MNMIVSTTYTKTKISKVLFSMCLHIISTFENRPFNNHLPLTCVCVSTIWANTSQMWNYAKCGIIYSTIHHLINNGSDPCNFTCVCIST